MGRFLECSLVTGVLLGSLPMAHTATPAVSAAVPAGYELAFEQTFEQGDPLKQFVFTDKAAWKLSGEGKDRALKLHQQSQYQPPVRSPVNIALLADRQFGDFILEVDLLQTGREYGHRDMCLFFGLQNPQQFYYVHIATKADPNAHNVFIVNKAPRKNFATKTTTGVNWGLEIWHRVRLERSVKSGSIKVYFDDLEQPIMEAQDTTFGVGHIGFGSFDDTGKVKNIRIWTPKDEPKSTQPTAIFQRP